MAAVAIKALNAKIRANPTLDYFCSTHFWGPASNFGIPMAAIADIQKDPEIISGTFTPALMGYSATFMRYSMAVTPKNYLLFACHFINFGSQSIQMTRWYQYWYMGGRDKALKVKAEDAGSNLASKASEIAGKSEAKGKEAIEAVKSTVQ